MKNLLTIILLVVTSPAVCTPSVFALSPLDAGGSWANPLYIQIQQDPLQQKLQQYQAQNTLNQQKENNLKSTYGINNYYSCSSGVSSLDLSNPSAMAQHLDVVQYCLERKLLNTQQSTTVVSSCPQGYVVKNGACVTPDAGCKATYGQNAKFDKYDSATGYPVCGCSIGYEWSSDGSSCVGVSVAPAITNDQVCQESWQNSKWGGTRNDKGGLICDCKTGYEWNEGQTACVAVPIKETISANPAVVIKKGPETKNANTRNKGRENTVSSTTNDEWKNPAYWNNKVATSTAEAEHKGFWGRIKGWFGF